MDLIYYDGNIKVDTIDIVGDSASEHTNIFEALHLKKGIYLMYTDATHEYTFGIFETGDTYKCVGVDILNYADRS